MDYLFSARHVHFVADAPLIRMNNAAPADEIIPRIWLGSYNSARDEEWLRSHGIQVVFNCTKDLAFKPCDTVESRYRVPVHDNLEPEEIKALASYSAPTAFEIVRHYKEGKTILVHCAAGMQRSAACTAFFLIAFTGCSAEKAINYIKSKRPIAFTPGVNFLPAIQYFDKYFHEEVATRFSSSSQPWALQ